MRGSILQIDLKAIADNYDLLCRKTKKSICSGVVKTNAYGLGLETVSLTLAASGCNHFFVTHIEEGIRLRTILNNRLYKDIDIYVLHGIARDTEPLYREHNLIPILNHEQDLELWINYSKKNNLGPLPSILHIDTGMTRLGLSSKKFERFINETEWKKYLNVKMVMSHLACGDSYGHEFNQAQLDEFKQKAQYFNDVKLSLCNSAGVFLGSEYHLDMVRPGGALYGVSPNPNELQTMKPVIRLKAEVVEIHDVDPGTNIGYGGVRKVGRKSKIATLFVGYSDGISRRISQGPEENDIWCVTYKDHSFPLIGRVSMDLLTVDVTDAPEGLIHEGVYLDLIGQKNTIGDLAQKLDTIGHEILTSIGSKANIQYINADKIKHHPIFKKNQEISAQKNLMDKRKRSIDKTNYNNENNRQL